MSRVNAAYITVEGLTGSCQFHSFTNAYAWLTSKAIECKCNEKGWHHPVTELTGIVWKKSKDAELALAVIHTIQLAATSVSARAPGIA